MTAPQHAQYASAEQRRRHVRAGRWHAARPAARRTGEDLPEARKTWPTGALAIGPALAGHGTDRGTP
jgi:hypothetical protein